MTSDQATPAESGSPRDVLRDMWTARRAEAEIDLDSLLSVLDSLADAPADAGLRSRAQTLAHQLVGVFGVFGFIDVKNAMARVDIELSDPAVPITDLKIRVEEIRARLP